MPTNEQILGEGLGLQGELVELVSRRATWVSAELEGGVSRRPSLDGLCSRTADTVA